LLDPPIFPWSKPQGAPCPQPVVRWMNQRLQLLCIYLSNSIYLCIIYIYIIHIYIIHIYIIHIYIYYTYIYIYHDIMIYLP
jgi:hypothetical protein